MTRRIILVDIGAGLTLRGVLPSVALFATYSAALKAGGGQVPYTYTVVAGATELATAGLYLDAATGIISGTTGVAGTLAFTVRVTDLSGAYIERPYSITVIAEPLSLSGAAPAWTVGTPYSYTYTAAHGVPPYTWSIAAGSLPDGITLNASTGTISGTPTEASAPAWTIRVADSGEAQLDLRDNVMLQLLGTFDAATADTAYSSDIAINGGDLPYSNPRVTVGARPAGLDLSIVGGKLRLSGTPTAAAASNFTVAVDSGDGQTATSAQGVVVSAGTVVALLHFDGPSGSVTFTDETGKIWTPLNGAAISTTVKKFGSGSGNFTAPGFACIYTPNSPDFDFDEGDFTIEGWIYLAGANKGGGHTLFSNLTDSPAQGGRFYVDNTRRLQYAYYGTGDSATNPKPPSAVIPLTTLTHVAVAMQGLTMRTFVGGVLDGIQLHTKGINKSSYTAQIGMLRYANAWGLNGYIDELRITKGVALYTDDFTPPSSPFAYP